MSSPAEASHADSSKFTARGSTYKALHGGHLLMYGDHSNKLVRSKEAQETYW